MNNDHVIHIVSRTKSLEHEDRIDSRKGKPKITHSQHVFLIQSVGTYIIDL